MNKNLKIENGLNDTLGESEISRIERNYLYSLRQLDDRMEAMERTLNKLSHHVASFEDALMYVARIPNSPLELEYDHKTNTLWTETRRKLEFNKNEAALISLMFSKTTGKPKKNTFQCSEVAAKLKRSGEGIDNSRQVFETIKRIQKKLDDFLNINESIVATTKSFYFSKIALN